MAPYAERARRHPDGIVDLSIGSPVDPTPTLIRDALAWATDAHAYPTTVGTPELRQAMVDWHARRRNATLGTDQVLPTIGSKEMVAWLPFMLGLGEGDAVVHPRVAYPTYEIGAALAGAESVPADDPADWPAHTRLVWLNSPGNPDGRVLGVDELRAAVARARELGAVIASDECYAELGWEGEWASGPTPSILDARVVGDDHAGVLALYSLSKQSNLAGYRAALVAGDRELIARLIRVRKHAGLLPPAPLQHAMTVALGDDAHVRAQRELYRARRDVLRPRSRTPAGASTAARPASTSGRPAVGTHGRGSRSWPTSGSSRVPVRSTAMPRPSTCACRSRRRTSASRRRPPGSGPARPRRPPRSTTSNGSGRMLAEATVSLSAL
ncbi:Glutamate-pyruvate aminotransferase AlaC [Clavibacter michiganensis subsp. michiganensis]|uniref:Aminotransferase n=1 Tax=Clavibacter michiganensis subsp. michiganensis TaxID=33013 RepID=A0A251XJ20_CLAMM|nr:Glutamate-pyruvate aminotransferase AlaC [Clavibacter michiganensis subsp. michiganensis]OUE03431.1 Glutamate-pyruvate aminotransferase AlaC [Clavibacter michiganensis subsp. michiganensis]